MACERLDRILIEVRESKSREEAKIYKIKFRGIEFEKAEKEETFMKIINL